MKDAYALCRVFKKSATNVQKVGDRYVTAVGNQRSSSSSISGDMYSSEMGGRSICEEVLDNTNYSLYSLNTSGSSQSIHAIEPPFSDYAAMCDSNVWLGGQSSSEEAFGFAAPPFSSYAAAATPQAITYPPSHVNKFSSSSSYAFFLQHQLGIYSIYEFSLSTGATQIDVALECARLQQRLLSPLPPLAVGHYQPDQDCSAFISGSDFPARESTLKSSYIPEEILSVAQATQDLFQNHHQSYPHHRNKGDGSYDYSRMTDEFSFSRYIGDDPSMRAIEIGDADEDGYCKLENLRWLGMSSKDLEKVWM